ncbi:uncharacterized protein BXZ73DRAFT_90185 [Epithele typhae]|uniref:uncharacterized protein n=1 Tax=Epithele typhae TaxID=378194 RepID=UPI002007A0A2|nr:uncharacterized protein BXZ73DRAFT_90185 [Epithele typhae]KAH9931100.1 hypothetical protein BXZ73DRAFT_90185 [Epithele typhae]
MQLTTGLPLLLALGARVFINAVAPSPTHTPSTPDYLLNGLFQGVLIHNTFTQIPQVVVVAVVGVAAKLLIDFVRLGDVAQTACTVLGAALGVLFTDLLGQFVDGQSGLALGSEVGLVPRAPVPIVIAREPPPDPPKRIRLVSFGRDRTRKDRHRERERDREQRERDDYERRRAHGGTPHPHGGGGGPSSHPFPQTASHVSAAGLLDDERHGRSSEVRAITPTLTYCSTAPSISLDSVPSSIDPEGKLTPAEREVAVLRARASLADSERRRFKEERKWAMSQGNTARASQLAWQVKRYTALMESFHREADAKVVEAARVAAAPSQQVSSSRRHSHSRQRKSSSSTITGPAASSSGQPLVSVSVSGRSRKRSGGTTTLKPAIFVQGRE